MKHLVSLCSYRHPLRAATSTFRLLHRKTPKKSPPPPAPPNPPRPPQRLQSFSHHDDTWEDPYSWMSNLSDKVAMRHMDVYMEQEEKYTEAVMSDSEKLQSKLMSEMASRLSYDLSTPPLRWGPWLYYRRVEDGKQYPVFCRRLESLHEEFISHKSPSAGFDFTSGKRIEQKLVDYNLEAEKFGGYAFEEISEVSPNHQFFAYTMYDKDKDYFKLFVRNLNSGSLCSKPQADSVSNLAWVKDGKALLYVVTDQHKRPYRIYYSMIGSIEEDILVHEESDDGAYINLRHTKDFQFVRVTTFTATSSKVFMINAADPLSGLTPIWECKGHAHCVVEHHQGFLYLLTDAAKDGQPVEHHYILRCPVNVPLGPRIWEDIFVNDELIIEDVDFCSKYMVLILREGRNLRICSVMLPLPHQKAPFTLKELNPCFLPLPKFVSQISSGANYDFYSTIMRFTISSPVMPNAVVDYDLSNGKWNIVQQQNLLHERTKVLYGKAEISFSTSEVGDDDNPWNELSEFYAYEYFEVPSNDGAVVPLTVVYSHKSQQDHCRPGLLHGHGAYGELLDKSWRSELKSLLDRGWVLAYADVRGGGGKGKRWHDDGRSTKKHKSIEDYISCARFLVEKGIVGVDKLAGWGYSAGGLLLASAINKCPDLFAAAVLKVPFLDPTNTLLFPILPLLPADYAEFGIPGNRDEFDAIRRYSPYDNIPSGVSFPAVMVTSSFNTRFGVWESAKWVARVRERTIYSPTRPILLNLTVDIVEENRYLQCKEAALETAFLIMAMETEVSSALNNDI